jgi:phage I-like protein
MLVVEDDGMAGVSYVLAKLLPAMKFQVDLTPEMSQALGDWFQIMYAGDFKKNGYSFEITPEVLDSMISNFNKDILKKKQLPIDYSHNNEQKAAGWITALKLGDDKKSLYAKAEWTPSGKAALLEKEFRFFSAEFQMSYYDQDSETELGAVLHGGALTNIPFLKLPPIIPLSIDRRELETILFQEERKMDHTVQLAKLETDLKAKSEEIKAKLALEEKNKGFDKLLKDGLAVEAQRTHYLSNDLVKFAECAVKVNPVAPRNAPVDTSKVILSDEETAYYEQYLAPKGVKIEDYIKYSRSDGKSSLIS